MFEKGDRIVATHSIAKRAVGVHGTVMQYLEPGIVYVKLDTEVYGMIHWKFLSSELELERIEQ